MGILGTAVQTPVIASNNFGLYFGAEDNTAGTAYTSSDGSGYAHVDYAQVGGTAIANTGAMVAPSTRITNLFPLTGIVSVNIRRGRQAPDQYDDVGEMTIVVNNQGDTGLAGQSDPDNNAGRYKRLTTVGTAQAYGSFLQPQMWGRWAWQPTSGSAVNLFTGVLETVEPTDDLWSQSTYTFVDRLSVIGRTKISATTIGMYGDTGAQRINLILDNGGLPNVINYNGVQTIVYEQATNYSGSFRDVKGFARRLDRQTIENSALDSLKQICDGEAGRVFANRDGVICVYDRSNLASRAASIVATFSDTSGTSGFAYDEIKINQAQDYIYNEAVITYGSAIITKATLDASIAQYGERSIEKEVKLVSAGDQAALAAFYATNWGLPKKSPVMISLETIGFSASDFATVAGIDLGQSVRVIRQQPGGRTFDGTAIVEGIEVDLTPESRRFTFYLSATDQTTITWP